MPLPGRIRFLDRTAPFYDPAVYMFGFRRLWNSMAGWAEQSAGSPRLDVCTGTGGVARAMARRGGRVVGCDVEAAFYRAVCLGQNREKEDAIVAAQRFLDDYPDAPERFKKAMEQIKAELVQEWESPLYDLAGRMNHVASKIKGGDTGDVTQAKQKEIVSIIEELIKKAEEQGNQGNGT